MTGMFSRRGDGRRHGAAGMKGYVLRRVAQLVLILFVITFLSFGMMRPGRQRTRCSRKMERTGMAASQQVIDAARAELGLDKPFLAQYVSWLGGLLRGDMGGKLCHRPAGVSHLYRQAACHTAADGGLHPADRRDLHSAGDSGRGPAEPADRPADPGCQLFRQQYAGLFLLRFC